jgi:hypothetical protein
MIDGRSSDGFCQNVDVWYHPFMHCFVPGKPQLITKHNSKNLEKMRVSQRYTKGGVRVNDALDPVGERERGPGKRVKGPKR